MKQGRSANAMPQGYNDVEALLHPNNIAIVGATERAGNWSEVIWNNLKRHGFAGAVYPVNPRYTTIWGGPCYPDVASLPEPPDHLVIIVPASTAIETLISGTKAGARSATVFAGGFGETSFGEERVSADRFQEVIAELGLAVSGPNCMGNLSARHKMLTIPDRRIGDLVPGPVAVIGQSGGIVTALGRAMADRGTRCGYMIMSGNELGLTTADYLRFFASDPGTQVVAAFIETIRNPDEFVSACKLMRDSGKTVVAFKIGGSETSQAATLSHTGRLAGSLQAFDAVTSGTGIIRVNSLDDVVETIEYVLHAATPASNKAAALTFSGGFKGLLLECAQRNGIEFPELAPDTVSELEKILGFTATQGNPIDGGFAAFSGRETYLAAIEVLSRDPNTDILLLQEELPRSQVAEEKIQNLKSINDLIGKSIQKPLAVVSMTSYAFTDFSRDLKKALPNIPFLQEVNKGLQTIANASRLAKARHYASQGEDVISEQRAIPPEVMTIISTASQEKERMRVLNEVQSKTLLKEYGLGVEKEYVAADVNEAVDAARLCGYPVALKAISSRITHKTDVGGVALGIKDESALRAAFERIENNTAAVLGERPLDGMLVAPYVRSGTDILLGIQNDREFGPVVVFGSGGVALELYQDIAFGAPPIDRATAEDMINSTRVGRLIDGYRGQAAMDKNAVIDALMAIGRVASDLSDYVHSVDVNPYRVFEDGEGGVVLDSLVVLKGVEP